jgi:hypothetical protein
MLVPSGVAVSLAAAIMPDGQLSVSQTWPAAIVLVPVGANPVKGDRLVWVSESQRKLAANELHTLTLTAYQAPAYVITNIRLDRALKPVLGFTRVGEGLELLWEINEGYALMTSKDLSSWTPVPGVQVQAGRASYRVHPVVGQAGFYQLRPAE